MIHAEVLDTIDRSFGQTIIKRHFITPMPVSFSAIHFLSMVAIHLFGGGLPASWYRGGGG
jgi:hypothetical protein